MSKDSKQNINLTKRFPGAPELRKYINGENSWISAQVTLFMLVQELLKSHEPSPVSTWTLLKQLKKGGVSESRFGCRLCDWVQLPVFSDFLVVEPQGKAHFSVSLTRPSIEASSVRKALVAASFGRIAMSLTAQPADNQKASREIEMFVQVRLSSAPATRSVESIVLRIKKAAARVKPGEYTVEAFGSTKIGLATQSSDVDLVIFTPSLSNEKEFMRSLSYKLRSVEMANCFYIAGARVPMISFVDTVTGLECDMSMNNTLGLQKTALLDAYLACDPRVRPLAMAVKHWAKRRCINDASRGFMNSFGYTLMLLAYLQMREVVPALQMVVDLNEPYTPILGGRTYTAIERSPRSNEKPLRLKGGQDVASTEFLRPVPGQWRSPNTESLHQLLYGFFYYYGVEHEVCRHAISVRVGVTDLPFGQALGGAQRDLKKLWYIEDPIEPQVNCAKGLLKNQIGIYREFQTAAFVMRDALHPLFDNNLEVTESDKIFMYHCHEVLCKRK
ncbi:Nucleotidyltransferase [Martensiomyces pterosporus]|nr:Nucleotidyltransferase [Martensiomyces pterosporus]